MVNAKKVDLEEIDLALRSLNPKNRKPYHSCECCCSNNGSKALQKLGKQLLPLIAQLEDRKKMVITLRYGLNGENPKTLQAIGLKLNRTRERIRQIQDSALARLLETI